MVKRISFISARGRKITKNFFLLKAALLERNKEYQFECYINDFSKKNQVTSDMKKERNGFAKKATFTFCCDSSLPTKNQSYPSLSRRFLFLETFDYLFKYIPSVGDHIDHLTPVANSFYYFTDIICYTPYIKSIAKKIYPTEKGTFYDDIGIPFADSLNNKDTIQSFREEAECIYPTLKGKKVLSILTSGAVQTGESTSFTSLDITALLHNLPKDWIIVTNNPVLLEKSNYLHSNDMEQFIYVTASSFSHINLLYFTDLLVTDNSYYACNFASKGLPHYVVDFKSTNYSNYILSQYNDLFLWDLKDLPDRIKHNTLLDSHKEFQEKFAPIPTKKACDNIIKLLEQ